MMKHTYSIFHVHGKKLVITDVLFRASAQQQKSDVDEFNGEVDAYVQTIFNSLLATDKRLQQIQAAQEEDPTCILLKKYCLEGWPSKQKLKGEISKYLNTASEFVNL